MRSHIITVSIIEHPIYDMHTIGKPCLISAMEIFYFDSLDCNSRGIDIVYTSP